MLSIKLYGTKNEVVEALRILSEEYKDLKVLQNREVDTDNLSVEAAVFNKEEELSKKDLEIMLKSQRTYDKTRIRSYKEVEKERKIDRIIESIKSY